MSKKKHEFIYEAAWRDLLKTDVSHEKLFIHDFRDWNIQNIKLDTQQFSVPNVDIMFISHYDTDHVTLLQAKADAFEVEFTPGVGKGRAVITEEVPFFAGEFRPINRARHIGDSTVDGHINWAALHAKRQKAAITMPPGFQMERVARWIYFFSPKTFRRISEEIVADYRHEMVEAIAKRASAAELRRIQIQHWGGFILAVGGTLWSGVMKLLKLAKALS